MLTEIEKKLAAILLRRAASTFSNHGCNDFDVAKEAGLTPEQSADLWKGIAKYNGDDPADEDSMWHETNTYHSDWLLMAYLADRLDTEGGG